jgi:hypothetical protein
MADLIIKELTVTIEGESDLTRHPTNKFSLEKMLVANFNSERMLNLIFTTTGLPQKGKIHLNWMMLERCFGDGVNFVDDTWVKNILIPQGWHQIGCNFGFNYDFALEKDVNTKRFEPMFYVDLAKLIRRHNLAVRCDSNVENLTDYIEGCIEVLIDHKINDALSREVS